MYVWTVTVNLLLIVTLELPHHECYGFNLWIKGSQKFEGPKESQFGFSVALWSDSTGTKRLVVGAPRSQKDLPPNFTDLRLGNIYLCNDSNLCSPHPRVPTVSLGDGSEQALSAGYTMKKYGMGFGMALSALKEDTSPLVACAPRYPRLQSDSMENRGACFLLSDDEAEPDVILPYPRPTATVKTIQDAMMGFSTTLINETDIFVVMGGPGAFYGEGSDSQPGFAEPWGSADHYQGFRERPRLSVKNSDTNFTNTQRETKPKCHTEGAVLNKPAYKTDRGSVTRITNTKEINKDDDHTYEGWQVVQGKFDGVRSAIAVSVVNYGTLKGKVKIYPKNMTRVEINPNNFLKEFLGAEVGARYGHSLGAGDFDGDSVDDLVISSPLSPVSHADVGKVLIYYEPLHRTDEPQEIFGHDAFGRFGLSVAGLGDINRDGFDDLAVGAPYGGADGKGSVYIYNGSPNGLRSEVTQVVKASEFTGGLAGFGFSLDGGIDIDHNGYPDVIIGAVESDEAVFLRSAPVVTLEGSMAFHQTQMTVDDKECFLDYAGYKRVKGVCFDMLLDFKYRSYNELSNITIEFRMVLSDQADPPQYVFKVTNDYRYSRNLTVLSVDENPTRTYVSIFAKSNRSIIGLPVQVSATAHLHPPPLRLTARAHEESFIPVPPILDPLSPTTFSASVILSCNNNKTCFSKPDMSLSAESDTLVIGEGPVNISVILDVRNDSAYEVEVTVTHPGPLKYLRVEGEGLIPECLYNRLIGITEYTKFICKFTFIEADEKVSGLLGTNHHV
ncbi:integrin [Halocaridina rubra]|uniref:Integrin n=1 Tax=Halocaridina rubra TaxID=373956 RepID=A0AAN9AFN3_HALRR